MATTAFITGGSGFLGRHLIAALRTRGDTVRALARSDSAAEQVRRAGAEPVRGDLEDEAALRRGMAGCDVVFHVAADTQPWGRYDEAYRTNVVGTEHVLAAARATGVSRLVHVSTEAVLIGRGQSAIVNADETWPRPKHPTGRYNRTKALAEERVLAANSAELTTMIVRPRLIWGAGDTSLWLPTLVTTVRAGSFRWIGGGHQLTATTHVANDCEGLILAAERGHGGEIYFVTDGDRSNSAASSRRSCAHRGSILAPGASRAGWRWRSRPSASGCGGAELQPAGAAAVDAGDRPHPQRGSHGQRRQGAPRAGLRGQDVT